MFVVNRGSGNGAPGPSIVTFDLSANNLGSFPVTDPSSVYGTIDVDLTKPLPPDQLKEVAEAFLKWKVIFFRGQHLDHAQRIDAHRREVVVHVSGE